MTPGQIIYRDATLLRASIDKEARTVELSFSSEAPVERSFGMEVLDHSPESVDLGRLRDGAPLLRNHDPKVHVGTILNPRIDGDRIARATAKLSRSAAGEEAFNDVVDGILRKVSVGYVIHQTESPTRNADGTSTVRVTKWEPLEISLVSIPADNSVGVGRSAGDSEKPNPIPQKMETPTPTPPAGYSADDLTEMAALASRFNRSQDLSTALAEKWPLDRFRKHVIASLDSPAITPASRFYQPHAAAAAPEFSLLSEIRHFVDHRGWRDSAFSQSEAVERSCGIRRSRGIMIDLNSITTRSQVAGTFTAGGALVPTVQGGFIDSLRARSVVLALGATSMTGLQGNVAFPRLTNNAAGQWLAETAQMDESSLVFGQISMTPHRIATYIDVSKELMIQTGGSAEAIVRSNLMQMVALAIDKAALQGSGVAGEPLGIVNTDGINATVTFGGAAVWSDVVQFETGIAVDDADIGTMGFAATPATRGKWKTILKDSVAGSGYLWPDNNMPNGYRSEVTSQITGDRVIFGVWKQVVVGLWDGVEILVDPYTQARSGLVRVYITAHADVAVTQPLSFNVSTDSGAQ